MKSDVKILKLMLDHKEERFTIRQISQRLKINYRIAHEQVGILEKEGLLMVVRVGKARLCELSNKFNHRVFEAEASRRDNLLMNKDIRVLHKRLSELNFNFIALVFGSYAKGTAKKHSDIDILTIGGDEKELKRTISLLPNAIHLTAVEESDFVTMAKSREFSVVSEAIKNNVILLGIEDYYRLLSNAR
ncbi:MAG: nucleotidyltransferase domain-containing protein [Nanoarchaeota archaeon]|nr:nucleotidyltransferase domain-containing protein [Nanoarchaeota archaeon]